MPGPILRAKPATPQWQPSHRLGAGLTFACIFTTSGATHRNIAGRGVSDVTLINASMTGGAYGPTAQFGSGTYARAVRSAATQPTGGYTVAALVRSNGTPGGSLPIMVCASVAPVDATWYLGVSGGLPRFARNGGGYMVAAASSYAWGTDYHLFAGTVLPTNNAATAGSVLLHANGVRIGTGSFAAAQAPYTADPLLVGSLYDSVSNSATAWPGDIAAVYIWRRPLSEAEHAALAADPFAPVRPRPRAWLAVGIPVTGTLGAQSQAATASLGATVAYTATLGATAQAASTSLAGQVQETATLGATAQAAATSLAAVTQATATLGATAGAASMSLTATVVQTIRGTFAAVASAASTAFGGGLQLRFLGWDAQPLAESDNPFEIDPDATRDDAY